MKKITATIVAIILALIAIAGSVYHFALNDKTPTETPPIEQPGDEGTDVPDVQPDQSEAINLPRQMAFSAVTQEESAGVLVKATVKPDNAYDKSVDWAVAWNNASSEWATGKTVTDYVTVTPLTDGSTTCTVKCLQEFGEQVLLSVTSRADTNITSTCNIDFAQKLKDVQTLQKKRSNGTMVDENFNFGANVTETISYNSNGRISTYFLAPVSSLEYGTGSIEATPTSRSMYIKYSEELKTAFTNNGLSIAKDGEEIDFLEETTSTGGMDIGGTSTTFYNFFGIRSTDANWETLSNVLASCNSHLELIYKVVTPYETREFSYIIKINASSMILPTSVELDNSTLVF